VRGPRGAAEKIPPRGGRRQRGAEGRADGRPSRGTLGDAAATFPGLHEHDRTGAPFGTQAEFELAAKGFFENPGEPVWGRETAEETWGRFADAVDGGVLARHPVGTVVVVAHGTVITLFLLRFADLDAFGFWRRLGLPSFCVVELPGYELREAVTDM
jgi:broad specificity phosphatase PhoE